MSDAEQLLVIDDLELCIPQSQGPDCVVLDGVSLEIRAGDVIGMIGESGAGKSMTAWAAMGLPPRGGKVTRGDVTFAGKSTIHASHAELRALRGQQMSLIVQNPRGSLNPLKPVGDQIANVYRTHNPGVSRKAARRKAVEALASLGFGDAEVRARSYPHQFSGGMAQRALIAMALINEPRLLIADEATTGLDVTVQAQILDLLMELVQQSGTALWLVTHDMGVVANYTDRAVVMFAGQVVEEGPTKRVFENPRHPYTRGLIAAVGGAGADEADAKDIDGPPPDLANRGVGCQFAYRCPLVEDACLQDRPDLFEIEDGHHVRCVVAERAASELAEAR